MKVRQVLALGVLSLATGAAFAGSIASNGEGSTRGFQGSVGPSQTGRAAVNSEVLEARANGNLIPAGGGSFADKIYKRQVAAPSTVTRSQVKDEVLQARADGTLAPAGEAAGFDAPGRNDHVAHHAAPAGKTVAARATK